MRALEAVEDPTRRALEAVVVVDLMRMAWAVEQVPDFLTAWVEVLVVQISKAWKTEVEGARILKELEEVVGLLVRTLKAELGHWSRNLKAMEELVVARELQREEHETKEAVVQLEIPLSFCQWVAMDS